MIGKMIALFDVTLPEMYLICAYVSGVNSRQAPVSSHLAVFIGQWCTGFRGRCLLTVHGEHLTNVRGTLRHL